MNLHLTFREDQTLKALGIVINIHGCIGVTFMLLWYTLHIGIGKDDHVSE